MHPRLLTTTEPPAQCTRHAASPCARCILDAIEDLLGAMQPLLIESQDPSSAFIAALTREPLMTQLTLLGSALPAITERVTACTNAARAAHNKDTSTVTDALAGIGVQCATAHSGSPYSDAGSHSTRPALSPRHKSRLTKTYAGAVSTARAQAGRTEQGTAVTTVSAMGSVSTMVSSHDDTPRDGGEQVDGHEARPRAAAAATPISKPIKFSAALVLNAVHVGTFDQVKQDGELYFVDSAEHFAVRLCGHLLHGNIGTIFIEDRAPVKIRDCKFADTCTGAACPYYHDPIRFPGSKDHRNFIASSWLYTPFKGRGKNKTRARQFGSRDSLDVDIIGLQPEELFRFHDQTMHDLLCSLLLARVYAGLER